MDGSHEVPAASPTAAKVRTLVDRLQRAFADRLEAHARSRGDTTPAAPASWLRDEGRHGGGTRLGFADTATFDRASLNVSGIHYDDLPDKQLSSATALSCIVHPRHPRAPSMHMHVSWTEMRSGRGYWRLMADLNPSIPVSTHQQRFDDALRDVSGDLFAGAQAQGERYFWIPAVQRHRGVCHFYLEGHNSGDWAADAALVEAFVERVITVYGSILDETPTTVATAEERQQQRAYHTLYLFQVLTLDRGTTSGLLVHAQNDVGILGSLPSTVNPRLLLRWKPAMPGAQHALVDILVDCLGDGEEAAVDRSAKVQMAQRIRAFYRAHPEALKHQARGEVLPPTVANHR